MSVVVGFGSDTRSLAALDLAVEFARTTGEELVVTARAVLVVRHPTAGAA